MEEIWPTPMTKAPIPSENESQDTTQWRHENFDYTRIADRLRVVSIYCCPTGVVKLVYGIPTFPLATKAVLLKCHKKYVMLSLKMRLTVCLIHTEHWQTQFFWLTLKLVRTILNVLLRRHFQNYLSLSMHLLHVPRMNIMLDFIWTLPV